MCFLRCGGPLHIGTIVLALTSILHHLHAHPLICLPAGDDDGNSTGTAPPSQAVKCRLLLLEAGSQHLEIFDGTFLHKRKPGNGGFQHQHEEKGAKGGVTNPLEEFQLVKYSSTKRSNFDLTELDNDDDVSQTIGELLKAHELEKVEDRKHANLFFLGTSHFRELKRTNPQKLRKLLEAVEAALKGFPMWPKDDAMASEHAGYSTWANIDVISDEAEGKLVWVAINQLMGHLRDGSTETAAVADLGGGSVEVARWSGGMRDDRGESTTEAGREKVKKHPSGLPFAEIMRGIYTDSYTPGLKGLFLNLAKLSSGIPLKDDSHADQQSSKTPTNVGGDKPLKSHCLPQGIKDGMVKVDGANFEASDEASYEKCAEVASLYVKEHKAAGGLNVGPMPDTNGPVIACPYFYTLGTFALEYKEIKLGVAKHKTHGEPTNVPFVSKEIRLKVEDFKSAAEDACKAPLTEEQISEQKDGTKRCAYMNFVYAFFKGLGYEDGKEILFKREQVVGSAGSVKFSWPYGKMLEVLATSTVVAKRE